MENRYKHELLFESLGHSEWLEICEPIGFDGAEFTQEQDGKRYGRDVNYLNIDKLSFVDNFGSKLETPRVLNPQGDLTDYLDYALPFHFETIRLKGFESVTKYRISLNGLYFKTFTLDYTLKDLTDGYSYVNCMVLDNNNITDFKRNFDTKFNALGYKDVKDNDITPIPTFKYLRKATPITDVSKLKENGIVATAVNTTNPNLLGSGTQTIGVLANPSNVIEVSGINNTLSFLSNTFAQSSVVVSGVTYPIPNDSGSFQLLEAKNDLTDVKINISGLTANVRALINNFGSTNVLTANGKARLILLVGGFDLETEPFTSYILWERNFNNVASFNNTPYNLPTDITLNIPVIERNQRVYLYFANDTNATFDNLNSQLAFARISTTINTMRVEIVATETAIDSVITASRYIDLIKQSAKFINGTNVNAPLFDINGLHYNQAVFCRNMITQNNYIYTTPKDVLESVMEVNSDYEIEENEIYIGRDKDYYPNQEIGVFAINPDMEANSQFNERLMINNLKYGYSKYAQDRVLVGTNQSIHTDSEWIVPNLQVENKKEVSNKFVRDGKYIQDLINIEIKTPTTTTQNDDDVLVEDMISLPSGSFGTFGARLLMRWTQNPAPFTSILEILNRDSNGDSGDVVINWNLLGLSVADAFEITQGVNIGTYEIEAITNSVLTLRNTSNITIFEGDGFIKVKYFYNGVFFQTRLSQGFSIPTTNILPNIFYSIKRNLKYFSAYLASCMLYNQTKLRNTYFKGNGAFESQLLTESTPTIENADYLFSEFDTPLIGTKTHDLELVVEYNDVYNYLESYKTTKGFIRCLDNLGNVVKGFVQKLSYNWLTNEFKVTIEELYESEILMLTYSNEVLNVNDMAYDLSGVSDWWKFENDYIKFYDNKSRAICNFYKYNLVNLNGIIYNSRLDLENALINL